MYDIRKSSEEPAYSDFFVKYLNLQSSQEALGVDLLFRYEPSSNEIYSAFQLSGDYVYPGPLEALSLLLDMGVRIVYGSTQHPPAILADSADIQVTGFITATPIAPELRYKSVSSGNRITCSSGISHAKSRPC